MRPSTGKKIVHFCNYSPIDSGIYPETRDLVQEELRVGYDAWIVDHIPDNKFRKDPAFHDELYKTGRIIGIEDNDLSQPEDLICWHSWVPESYWTDASRNIVMFLHAMPSHLFYNELYGGEKVLSFLKNAHVRLSNCRYYITLWPSHKPHWENLLSGELVVADPIISCDCIRLKPDTHFDPRHLKLVVMDTWRAGKEPYYIFHAVQLLMAKVAEMKLPFQVTLDVYGQEAQNVQPVWHSLIRDTFADNFRFKGKDQPQYIFDTHDILLTQVGEISTESRVIREALLSGTPIVSGHRGVAWTPFQHDCRDVEGYAEVILSCWSRMQDAKNRSALHRSNRAYACRNYDIQKNAIPIFDCYEKVFETATAGGSSLRPYDARQNSPAFFSAVREEIQTSAGDKCLENVLAKWNTPDPPMSKEEALVRLMLDLPRSG